MTTISAFPRATDAVKHASAMTAPVDQTAAAQPATGRIVGRGRRLATRALGRLRSDQGDVPGWVLITLMTAAIVIGLWTVASDQIIQIFQNAMAPFLDRELG